MTNTPKQLKGMLGIKGERGEKSPFTKKEIANFHNQVDEIYLNNNKRKWWQFWRKK